MNRALRLPANAPPPSSLRQTPNRPGSAARKQPAALCRNAASPGSGRGVARAPQHLPSRGCQKSFCRDRRNRSAFTANVQTSAKPSAATLSPKSGLLQQSTRQTPANHLSSSPRLAERGTDRRQLPPRGAERDEAPAGARGSASKTCTPSGTPKCHSAGRKSSFPGKKAAAIAKSRWDGILPEQLVSQISNRVINPSQTASKPAAGGGRAALDPEVHPLPFLGCAAPSGTRRGRP